MNSKYLLAATLIASFTAPAFAATTTPVKPKPPAVWYVVENPKTMKCSVTTKKPDGTKYTDVTITTKTPDGVTFATKTLAMNDEKNEAACKPAPKP